MKLPIPVAVELLEGTSLVPFMVAVKVMVVGSGVESLSSSSLLQDPIPITVNNSSAKANDFVPIFIIFKIKPVS